MPDTTGAADLLSRIGGLMLRLRGRIRWPNWFGWRQWLVLFAMGVAVIVVEYRNHSQMWREHGSGQTVLTDHEMITEIILFGLVFPILAGVVLGRMGRVTVERDQVTKELQLRQALVAKMQGATSRQELADIIVTTPGNISLADRAWLLGQRAADEEFYQLARWERPGLDLSTPYWPVNPAICEQCEQRATREGTRVSTCNHQGDGSMFAGRTRYCLWLSSERAGKVALLFDLPLNRFLDIDQIKVLDNLGDEIALAVENANLHEVKQRQIDAAKAERLRIARDLHDTLGQNVSYLRLRLEQLGVLLLSSERPGFQEELASLLAVADEVYEQVRDTLEELRTTEHQDLEETVRLYAAQVAERSALSVRVHESGQPGMLPVRKSRQAMYIVREALNNIEKHAAAQNVDVHLQWSASEFQVAIRDDGKGFQSEELNRKGQYGLTIMDERARAVSGRLSIASVPGEGTEVVFSLPLSGKAVATLGEP